MCSAFTDLNWRNQLYLFINYKNAIRTSELFNIIGNSYSLVNVSLAIYYAILSKPTTTVQAKCFFYSSLQIYAIA